MMLLCNTLNISHELPADSGHAVPLRYDYVLDDSERFTLIHHVRANSEQRRGANNP